MEILFHNEEVVNVRTGWYCTYAESAQSRLDISVPDIDNFISIHLIYSV